MTLLTFFNKSRKIEVKEARLTKKETPYVILMILLDIAAPIFLLFGISMSNSSTAALLGTLEIAATSIIVMFIKRFGVTGIRLKRLNYIKKY